MAMKGGASGPVVQNKIAVDVVHNSVNFTASSAPGLRTPSRVRAGTEAGSVI